MGRVERGCGGELLVVERSGRCDAEALAVMRDRSEAVDLVLAQLRGVGFRDTPECLAKPHRLMRDGLDERVVVRSCSAPCRC